MRKLFVLLFVLVSATTIYAESKTLNGKDETGTPGRGVSVSVKNKPTLQAVSNAEGGAVNLVKRKDILDKLGGCTISRETGAWEFEYDLNHIYPYRFSGLFRFIYSQYYSLYISAGSKASRCTKGRNFS